MTARPKLLLVVDQSGSPVSDRRRDDTLDSLKSRRRIDEAQYAAGRDWQAAYEAASIGGLRGADLTRPVVDGGVHDPLSEQVRRAVHKLIRCDKALGDNGAAIVRRVLGDGHSIARLAADSEYPGEAGERYFGQRFREALSTLAVTLGYATHAAGRQAA